MSADEFDVNFKSFGKPFQERVLQALLSDYSWAQQMMEVMRSEYFDVKYLQYLFELYSKHYNEYKTFPSIQLLASMAGDSLREGNDDVTCMQVVAFLQNIKSNPNMNDLPYVKDRSLNFCKNQALKEALEEAVDLTRDERYDEIVGKIKAAITVGTPNTTGHDFFEDIAARFIKDDRSTVGTGLPQLDARDIMNGGLGAGELGVIMAGTGVGKCVHSSTVIRVKHDVITTNERTLRPWDLTGPIEADDVISINSIERDVTVGELFTELRVPNEENLCVENSYDIKILSCTGWEKIEGFRRTERLQLYRLTFDGGHLDASADHLLMVKTGVATASWQKLSTIKPGHDMLLNDKGEWIQTVEMCKHPNDETDILYDLQVGNLHCMYTNGVLSHNSHFLVQVGANALRAGRNVLHYTFELSEKKVGIRYDSNLSGVSATDVLDEKEAIVSHYRNNKYGRLIIKDYPTNTATVMTLKAHIEKLAITKNFRPDLIIIDYADIMRSTRQFDSLRHELKLIYEELRSMSMELCIPIWTASQTNRESTDSEVVGLDKISEAYGKAMVCDFIISLARKPLQKSKGVCNLFIPKNRLGKDGILFPAKIDTARSTFTILDSNIDLEDFEKSAENSTKLMLKDMWNEVINEKVVEIHPNKKAKLSNEEVG